MFEIVCGKCGARIYAGDEVKSPKQILRLYKNQCRRCQADLDPEDFEVTIASNV